MSENLLQVKELRTYFDTQAGELRAVDNVTFDINRGETVAILGESGCGKSMSALSVLQLVPEPAGRIAGGSIELEGLNLLGIPEMSMRDIRGRRIAMIFQEPQSSLNPVMTVGRQVMEVLPDRASLDKQGARDRVVELFRSVGIADPERRIDEYPHQLSGGMKQRVMIAMALACQPDVLVADEPTTALDVTIQKQILDLLKTIQQNTGMAILLITHDLGVVRQMAHRVLVMYAGQLVEAQVTDTFFRQPRHPYAQMLFRALPGRGKRGEPLAVIPGMVPPLTTEFSGCRFVERCQLAKDQCREQLPEWQGDKHNGVRCHFSEQLIAPATTQTTAASDSTATSQSILEVNGLQVHFPIQKGLFKHTVGHVKAVDGVSFSLAAGRTLALVGESGCGKTTVGKSLLRLINPTGGVARYQGTDLAALDKDGLRAVRRDLQIIFQDPYASLNPRMLVGDIIQEGMKALGVINDSAGRAARVSELLDRVGLPASAASRYPHEFSGGQRQRISVARALAVEPKLIVCDEPTSALDVSVQAQVLNLLKDLQDDLGLAYLFITHDLSVVEYLAHDIAVMYLGRIVESGPAAAILDNPQHPYTQTLLSAIPRLDSDDEHALRPGSQQTGFDIPSPSNPPNGCHFHPRCPKASEHCRQAYPDSKSLDNGHVVSCHLV
ncbi:MAG: ABC transporter ATP-binding protein [Gammaproteobacteria bacterium]|nr:ABC transporter ATP-binding protein [Gammaproteobacteria bacterium]